jgi:iron complex outermembrane receptor protein
MRFIITHLFCLIIAVSIGLLEASGHDVPKASLSGRITDKNTGEPLIGVMVYFPELKSGTVSDADGIYKIDNLPPARVLIQLSYISYRTIFETIDLGKTNRKDFQMEYVATELNEVTVTGQSKATEQKRNPTPIAVVPRIKLLQNACTNIIDAISHEPGISQITTGAGISKPVIRGLGYNRVVVINDGIRQEGQQWGDEHGIEIDEASVVKVEILKGPASLAYGSDALAGVINLISLPTLPAGNVSGRLVTNYQDNNRLTVLAGRLAGNLKGFVWDVNISNKVAHAYRNKYDGYIYNSGFREHAASGTIGLTRAWGYTSLTLGIYNLNPGIIEGERDSLTGKFVRLVAVDDSTEGTEIVSAHDLKSGAPSVPYQKIHHYKAVINSTVFVGNTSLRSIIGFQQNRRQEYGEVLNPEQYGLYFLLNTVNYDLQVDLPEKHNLRFNFGINGMCQDSKNKGEEYLVPEYSLFDFGIFTVVKKSMGNFDISGGFRYDIRYEHGRELLLDLTGEKNGAPEPGAVKRFTGFHSVFNGYSGSIGTTWQISRPLFTKLNFSAGFRAPNIGELGSNGIHEGTQRYEIGDPRLKPENSLQLDYTFGVSFEHISAEMNLFNNDIRNYIFERKLTGSTGGDSVISGVDAYQFVAGHVRLYGGEIRIDIHPHPLDWIHFENAFSLVQSLLRDQPDSSKHLPMIPAPRLQTSLRFDARKIGSILGNAYLKLEIEKYFTQNQFYAAYGTETKTPGYTLVNVGAGFNFLIHSRTLFSLYVSVENIADVAYQNHLSRLKYLTENYTAGRKGVFNMGRNVSFRLVIPFNITGKSAL